MGNESVESVAGVQDPCMATVHIHQLLQLRQDRIGTRDLPLGQFT